MNEMLSLTPAGMGILRLAIIIPELRLADPTFNSQVMASALASAAGRGCRLALFPELSLTGYSCADLFYQATLHEQALVALDTVAAATAAHDIAAVVGLPLAAGGRLYNCAAFLAGGQLLGLVPKSYLPTTNEFYEARWFTPASNAAPASSAAPASNAGPDTVTIHGRPIPFGADLLFAAQNLPDAVVGIEICEDLWAVNPPSGDLALAGATLLLNPSASNELLGKVGYRRDLVRQQSARCLAAYLYAGSGPNESTTDLVWAGHGLIVENGEILAETERFRFDTQIIVSDVDVQRLVHERLRNSTFAASRPGRAHRTIPFTLPGETRASQPTPLLRPQLSRTPFVPSDPTRRAEHCREIFNIQATALARRLRHTGRGKVTLGLSGGLDSTLALLVIVHAYDRLGLPRADILAITMPGFGTTARTQDNATRLAHELGISLRTIPITAAVRQHFQDIGHDENVHDVTYENAQARERTQILMDVANQVGGFNVGTGDLSELALGWCTYNADQMSMYHVNAGVPKTLVRYLVAWAAEAAFSGETTRILQDICATPISPELLPLASDGVLAQKTEESIGPYELHDFFLYYVVRFQFAPRKIFALAQQAFAGEYTPAGILHWLAIFYQRFFSQQFKRSAMPDGPKVGSVALSPRGDWRMPSDASSAPWLAEVAALQQQLAQEA